MLYLRSYDLELLHARRCIEVEKVCELQRIDTAIDAHACHATDDGVLIGVGDAWERRRSDAMEQMVDEH